MNSTVLKVFSVLMLMTQVSCDVYYENQLRVNISNKLLIDALRKHDKACRGYQDIAYVVFYEKNNEKYAYIGVIHWLSDIEKDTPCKYALIDDFKVLVGFTNCSKSKDKAIKKFFVKYFKNDIRNDIDGEYANPDQRIYFLDGCGELTVKYTGEI